MRNRRRRSAQSQALDEISCVNTADLPFQIQLYCEKWILKALVDLGGHKSILHEDYCSEPHLMNFLTIGLSPDDEYDRIVILSALKNRHKEVIKHQLPDLPEINLIRNINWLSTEVGLTHAERTILLFCVIERQHPFLRQTVSSLGEMSTERAVTTLAVLLDLAPSDVYKSLSLNSSLIRSGLISIDQNNIFDFSNKIELINGITERINAEPKNPFDIFSDNFVVAPEPTLNFDQFSYLGSKIEHFQKYIKQAIESSSLGVNVLLYGSPGSGKTQLARSVAKKNGAHLFEVAVEDREGARISGTNRMAAYKLSQRILSKRKGSVLMFDEIEDIQSSGRGEDFFSHRRGNQSGQKAWINQLLEQNSVPAIWVTNNVQFLDPAHLRRFDLHIHVDIPPLSIRARMLQEVTSELNISPKWCESVAANEALSPALITRAAKVTRAVYSQSEGISAQSIMDEVVSSALNVQNHQFSSVSSESSNLGYDISAVNADCDLHELIEGLQITGEGRICLYGPPGTGKSAFAQHTAKMLGKPVLIKRASNILAPFVGETESRMASMFNEARQKNAVLILDEADSFLRSRENAHRNWEVSMVNEMLTQMEMFQGIFFCTTNLIDQLDEASMRRFDLKANFSYLKSNQIAALFKESCDKLKIVPESNVLDAASQMSHITPGDFANMVRQARLKPIKTSSTLLERLRQEVCHKQSKPTRPIGFLTNAA